MNAETADRLVPVLPLQSTVVYPQSVVTVQIALPENLALLAAHREPDVHVAIAFSDGGEAEQLDPDALGTIAVMSRIIDRLKLPGDTWQVTFQGLHRVRLGAIDTSGAWLEAPVEPVDERTLDPFRVNVFVQKAINLFEHLVAATNGYSKEFVHILKMNVDSPGRFADLLGAALKVDYSEKLRVIEAVGIDQRLQRLLDLLREQLHQAKVAAEVEKRAKGDIEESRREYFLRQQLKTIQRELGDEDLSRRDADDYTEKLDALGLPDEITKEAAREIERLRHIQPSSSEYQVIKTYLDRFFALPWGVYTDEHIELPKVRETLDDGHFGLEMVKERILEFLAVRKLNPDHKGPILCFIGPPGVGKTSLGKAIAEAIGREFFRISVGGVRDEAEIRGHRRTYVGALPGKILGGLTRAGTMNPLLMLDEIDKIGSDHRGDPAAALLEVLDPEQNDTFTDHYFNVPFDLSKVLFIVTGNYIHDIPKPLLDRLEVITIEGYTENEKLEIGRRHLVPKVTREHGLGEHPPTFEPAALRDVIRYWTREAGVRNLQRNLEKLARKIAREQVEATDAAGPDDAPYTAPTLTPDDLSRYLGPKRYLHDEGIGQDEIGAANGLAWTASGGEILVIESQRMKGKGKLVITGKLGEVMKESVQAAYSFVRSRAGHLGLDLDGIDDTDLHIHFPAGAVPKDGPSAGVTVTLALASLLSGLPVRADVAMTGEVTLRGKVLPVGGVKDKLLAAYRANIKHVVLPKDNQKDLVELPEEVAAAIELHPIGHVDELLAFALVGYRDTTPAPVERTAPPAELPADLPAELPPEPTAAP